MKIISLVKAAFSQDMNIFKYSSKKNSSKLNKILFPIILFTIVCLSVGVYAFTIGEELAKYNLTFVMLSLFIIMVTMLNFIEGIYKSQGILFEAKDNDLLFSLPIKKSQILFIRILKLLAFQYIFNLMFLLPAFAVYVYFELPGISFYLISFLMTFLIPIIPTVISSFLGYIVKLISSKFKSKKIMQTILSSIVFLGVFYLLMNIDSFIVDIAQKASGINDIITKIYYPIGEYLNLIAQFNFVDLIKLLAVNLIPLLVFIAIGAKYYFQIISRQNGTKIKKNKKNKELVFTKRKPIVSLTKKELKRYISSPVYMFNTSFGLILSVVVSVFICIKGKEAFDMMLNMYDMETNLSLPILFYFFILFVGAMTSISSSSISLEGKTINITKSMPVTEKTILQSKILTCFAIELPFILLSDYIFLIVFNPGVLYSVLILLLSFTIVLLSAVIGLIANLKYPKMNASNDTEVVKQSMSSMISVFGGMGILVISIIAVAILMEHVSIDLLLIAHVALLIIISFVLYKYLMTKGVKEYRKINA